MKLDAEGPFLIAEGLVGIDRALCKQFGALRQVEPFHVKLIDLFRPGQKRLACLCRRNRIPADLRQPVGMRLHRAAKMAHHHLRAKTNAEKRFVFGKWHGDPVDFLPDIVVRIIGTHRPAEDHRARMTG